MMYSLILSNSRSESMTCSWNPRCQTGLPMVPREELIFRVTADLYERTMVGIEPHTGLPSRSCVCQSRRGTACRVPTTPPTMR
jgi:hypothetical protein